MKDLSGDKIISQWINGGWTHGSCGLAIYSKNQEQITVGHELLQVLGTL